jgi:hypothetical protein
MPEMKWTGLESGIAEGKSASKPVIVVFATEGLKSPSTFNRARTPNQVVALRQALTASGAITTRVLPPKPPRNTRGMSSDEIKAARESYNAAVKEYRETARKYGVSMYPTMVFLAPEGDVMGRLFSPDARTIHRTLKALPRAIAEHRKKKAREAAAKAKIEAAKKEAEASAKKTGGAPKKAAETPKKADKAAAKATEKPAST